MGIITLTVFQTKALSTKMHVCVPVYLFACLPIYLSTYLSIHPSIHPPSIHPSATLFFSFAQVTPDLKTQMKPEMYLRRTSNFFIDQLQSKTQSQVNP